MNDSGPLKNSWMPTCPKAGIRRAARSIQGSRWSQSAGSVRNSASSGMPSVAHGLAFGSKKPTMSLPASLRA